MEVLEAVLLALTIIMEARGQPDAGKAMVAQVVMNRADGGSIEAALFQEGQFAVWAPDVYGPGYAFRMAVLECYSMGVLPYDPWCVERWMEARAPDWPRQMKIGSAEYWADVWSIAVDVYEGTWSPPADLAEKTHFDNPIFWPEGLPPWMENCERLGDHVFCD